LHNFCVTAVELKKDCNYRKNNNFDYSFYTDCGYAKTKTAVTAINQTTTGKIQSTGSMNTLCLFPEKRFITNNSNLASTTADGVNSTAASISKVAIHTNWFLDLYTLVGSGNIDGGWYTTIMQLPFMSCIWIGFFFGIFAGVNALQMSLRMRILSWQ
jgi:cytochrome c biogenesis factor